MFNKKHLTELTEKNDLVNWNVSVLEATKLKITCSS